MYVSLGQKVKHKNSTFAMPIYTHTFTYIINNNTDLIFIFIRFFSIELNGYRTFLAVRSIKINGNSVIHLHCINKCRS